MKKKIFCILHAITDDALEDLGGLTPLQKANCPYLDTLARQGDFVTVNPPQYGGIATAIAALIDEKTPKIHLQQGPLQAYARGYRLAPQQRAFSTRFVATGEDVIIDVDDDIITNDEGKALCKYLNKELRDDGCCFFHVEGPRAMMITDNSELATLPTTLGERPITAMGKKWLGEVKSEDVKKLLKKISDTLKKHEINSLREDLEENFINAVLLSQGGTLPYEEFENNTNNERKILLTTSETSKGIARLLNINTHTLKKEQKKYDNIACIMQKLDTIFEKNDTVFIEIFYLWDSTYKGNLLEKVKTIEYLDKNIIRPLKEHCDDNNTQLTVMPLKQCSITAGEWKQGPVPVVIYPTKGLHTAPAFEEQYLHDTNEAYDITSLQ
ncbi:MAG: hypothetical protein HN411_00345 [Waddliaceae bacterium]|jgi:2,3-bisphosphoglycerate-independent phosphoglycerate mutase|nr:hypothetical protein [Waddliaceae bacterium]MBT3578980.1 hypothetical protein [Waddliaceae bacterium]MBT4444670.1 hypothetical protein [Waddliaceae bacterium]MBT6929177.1 hypothetical protein [Waddliaceae bacterium]MBT7265151.1 hypothetical protein [Waddliaceae bacterium]